MNLRKIAFWSLDFLRGRRIGRHYAEIKRLINSSEDIQPWIDGKIAEHLEYVAQNVPYYADYRGKKLEEFPVVNKILIRSTGENQFLSREFDKNDLLKSKTSGSTGIPFTSYRNREKQNRATAGAIYFNSLMGYELGCPWIYYCRLYPENHKTALRLWCENENRISVLDGSPERLNQLYRDLICCKHGTMLMGYTCFLLYFARQILSSGLFKPFPRGHFTSIIGSSELLLPKDRQILSNFFNAPVFSQYGCMEFGIIGAQFHADKPDYILNRPSFYVEILDLNKDVPVSDGQTGRIVVTDLYNRALALVRYDTGDIGIMEHRVFNGIRTPVLTSIEGRKNDIILGTNGQIIHGLFLHNCIHTCPDFMNIIQYQFIQKDATEYLIRINTVSKFNSEEELRKKLTSILGENASIQFEYVDDIPVLLSGKRKMAINEYLDSQKNKKC